MNPKSSEYFKHFIAWRTAFFAMVEAEQQTEIRCRGVENTAGWIYRSQQPTDRYSHVKRHYTTPKFP